MSSIFTATDAEGIGQMMGQRRTTGPSGSEAQSSCQGAPTRSFLARLHSSWKRSRNWRCLW